MRTTLAALTSTLLLAACGGDGAPNGFTYPGLQAHEQYFPLMGTAHEPATSPPAADYCTGCHATSSFRDQIAPVNCRGCHFGAVMTADPAMNPDAIHGLGAAGAVTGYAEARTNGGTNFCRQCHPLGQAGITDAAHHTFFPVGAGTKHNRSCVACHGSTDKKDIAALRCISCHSDATKFPNPAAWKSLVAVHQRVQEPEYPIAPTPRHCLRCHDQAQVLNARHARLRDPGGFGSSGPCDGQGAEGQSGDAHCGTNGTSSACWKCHNMLPPDFGGTGPGVPGRPWAQDWSRSDGCRASGCHGR